MLRTRRMSSHAIGVASPMKPESVENLRKTPCENHRSTAAGGMGSKENMKVPVLAMYVLAVIGFVSCCVTVCLSFTYARMALKVSDYNVLQAENTELKVEKKNLEVSTKKLNTNLSEI